jgi:hypothetical protein
MAGKRKGRLPSIGTFSLHLISPTPAPLVKTKGGKLPQPHLEDGCLLKARRFPTLFHCQALWQRSPYDDAALPESAITMALITMALAPRRGRRAEHRNDRLPITVVDMPILRNQSAIHESLNPSVEPTIMYLSQLVHAAQENING